MTQQWEAGVGPQAFDIFVGVLEGWPRPLDGDADGREHHGRRIQNGVDG
jgi:hypothetical protein